jgi:hypothetical protein
VLLGRAERDRDLIAARSNFDRRPAPEFQTIVIAGDLGWHRRCNSWLRPTRPTAQTTEQLMGIDIGGFFSGAANMMEEGLSDLTQKLPDPLGMGIHALGSALGLDPKLTGGLEMVASFMTGDLAAGVYGAKDILSGKSEPSTSDPATTRSLHGAQPVDSGYSTPPADNHATLQTIRDHFAQVDADGDGKISSQELWNVAGDPTASPDLRAACQALSGNAALMQETGTKIPSLTPLQPVYVMTVAQLDEALTRYPASSVAGSNPPAAGSPAAQAPAPSAPATNSSPVYSPPTTNVPATSMDEQTALQTIRDNFDLFDTAAGVGKPDGLIGRNDLQAILNNPNVPANVKAAAKFMLDNPAYFNKAETAQFHGQMDGLLGRGDVDAELARIGGSSTSAPNPPTAGTQPATSPSTQAAPASDTSSNSNAESDDQINADINAIFNDPSMSMEDKILAILMKLQEKQENKVQGLTKSLVDTDNANNAATAKDPNAKTQSIQGVQMKLQQAMSQMNELQTFATNFEKNEHDTKMSVINNIR